MNKQKSKSDSAKAAGSHYDFPGGVQVLDITRHLGFREGSIVKYLCRLGRKDGESRLADLLKCQKYLDDLISSEIDERARSEALGGSVTPSAANVTNHKDCAPSGCEIASEAPSGLCGDCVTPSTCEHRKECLAKPWSEVPGCITRAGVRREIK